MSRRGARPRNKRKQHAAQTAPAPVLPVPKKKSLFQMVADSLKNGTLQFPQTPFFGNPSPPNHIEDASLYAMKPKIFGKKYWEPVQDATEKIDHITIKDTVTPFHLNDEQILAAIEMHAFFKNHIDNAIDDATAHQCFGLPINERCTDFRALPWNDPRVLDAALVANFGNTYPDCTTLR